MEIRPIAHIRTPFREKFGIPRQSGLVDGLHGAIVFEPEFKNPDALRGLEGFDRIWLIWEFSANSKHSSQAHPSQAHHWQPTVRPPRLGGNSSMGVFATRSPFRPNPLGLSCVKIDSIELGSPEGPLIHVSGADLMDGTPIYDIKPYVPYADAFPLSRGGFTTDMEWNMLDVVFEDNVESVLSPCEKDTLAAVLSQDPRPQYHEDPERIYGMSFGNWNIKFTVDGSGLHVKEILPLN